jgi:hypothetical protein
VILRGGTWQRTGEGRNGDISVEIEYKLAINALNEEDME